ncbi:MAG: hypothetical protein J0L53_00870 [Spirochaetes bacterium]|nr:hypothetical protein [Spirochaetota bacterium]
MSHLMAYAFERFVFFQAATADRERIAALQILNPRLTPARVHFADSLPELEGLRPADLLVCCGDTLTHAFKPAGDMGHVTVVTMLQLQAQAAQMISLQSPAVFGEVVLAFLPDLLRAQAMRMFSLFGFNPVAVDSTQALLKELKHGASLVVFDQDMPVLRNRVHESREKIFSLLRAERRQHRQLAVLIIKDFDQGSLFGDMTTLAKDVSNAMLSPHEFLEFIRNYLCDFHVSHATWKLKVGNATGLAQTTYTGRPSAYLGLADVKSAFQMQQDRAYHEFMHAREQMIVETHDLAVRMAVTEWLFDKELAHRAEAVAKSLLIKAEIPRVFERGSPQVLISDPGAGDDPPPQDIMFN